MTPGGLESGRWRTAYGILSVMRLRPDDVNWNDATVHERVSLERSTCPESWGMCEGTDRSFPIGRERYSTILGTLPALQNRIYDFHVSRWGRSMLHDASQNPKDLNSCQVVCKQEYVCGDRALGEFTITRAFRKDMDRNRPVTVVDVTKT